MNKFLRSLLLLMLVATWTGCGSGLVQVQGEVLLDDKPLPKADIALIPQAGGRMVTGKSDAQGKFQLTTNKPGDGVAPGTYTVTVTAREVTFAGKPGSEEGFSEKHKWIAPEQYSDPGKSGLTTTIVAGQEKLPIELKSKP